jgi:hypothetical protein
VAELPANTVMWTDSNLLSSTVYLYAVAAFNSAGESPRISLAAGTRAAPPVAADGLTATVHGLSVNLQWNSPAAANWFTIKRAESLDGPFVMIALVDVINTFSETNLVAGITYFYQVVAGGPGGEAPPSETVKATITAPGASSAQFLGLNTKQRGNWKGKVGSEGYSIVGDAQNLPTYVTMNVTGKSDWNWQYSTSDNRALQRAENFSRVAACWFSPTTFDVDLNFTDGNAHQVSFYSFDCDRAIRKQKIDIIDFNTGQVLRSTSLNGFSNGVYASYKLSGHVIVRFTRLSSHNAVVSGIFFDSPTH